MFTIREPHGRSLKYRQMVLMVQMVRYGYPLLNYDYHPKAMCRERSVKDIWYSHADSFGLQFQHVLLAYCYEALGTIGFWEKYSSGCYHMPASTTSDF